MKSEALIARSDTPEMKSKALTARSDTPEMKSEALTAHSDTPEMKSEALTARSDTPEMKSEALTANGTTKKGEITVMMIAPQSPPIKTLNNYSTTTFRTVPSDILTRLIPRCASLIC